MNDKKLMNKAADNIRILAAAMVEKAKSGHPGGAMGGADFINTLYSEFLVYDPENPNWEGRDRFFLDPGHMAPMLYSQLALIGKYSLEDLKNLRQWGSVTPGHPERELARGIENTSGPLGQGHTFAVGAAIAAKFLNATRDIVPNWLLATPDPMVSVGYRCEGYPVEMIVRGYLCGSAWRAYKAGAREICGVQLPEGMRENEAFPTPIITPTTKAEIGTHDEDISREEIIAAAVTALGFVSVYKFLLSSDATAGVGGSSIFFFGNLTGLCFWKQSLIEYLTNHGIPPFIRLLCILACFAAAFFTAYLLPFAVPAYCMMYP